MSATVKRIKGFFKLKMALSTLHGALPDATTEELLAFNDECAICRVRSFLIFLICGIYSFKTAAVGGDHCVIDRNQWPELKSYLAITFFTSHA